MSTLLTIRSLDAGFSPEKKTIANVSFDVKKSEVLALIGPSGCGKSTLLRCVNRLHEETQGAWVKGAIDLEGKNIYSHNVDPVEVRAKIGMVFQKPNPFPGLTIYENVAAGLLLKGIRRKSLLDEVVEDSLKAAALWDEVKDKLKTGATRLSGGQQQRLCIARSLAIGPPIILMDEPTSALDPISTGRIEELIIELRSKVTVLIVTHNLQQAGRISDRVGFMYLGEMVEFGQTSQLFTAPKDRRTENYITGKFG